ncbi:MAG: N-acetylglucosamine-6-phosphate deacetylase [Bacteroidetes bacterium]|nr:N-acetylglucosamine-6-phosphate deacetylase [Bacteroidota bacterium]
MTKKTFLAKQLFTGSEYLHHHAVIVEDNKIVSILPFEQIPPHAGPIYDIIAPAFIDIQIYGAHGKLLAVYPNADSIFRLYDYCSKGGASHFVVTVATNSKAVFHACIDAVKEYWDRDGRGCLGLHVEGPWINASKKGAHLEEFIHTPSIEEVKELLAYGKGVIKIITLAPEVCSKEIVALIQATGIIVSAGHSNATFEEATFAFDQGIGTATHLYNAMSPLQHRSPGFVGAVFNHPTVMSSVVPDGYHVDFEAIKIAKKQMGERLFVITDAVAETTIGPYPHHLVGDKYESNGILSGSALTMVSALKNLVKKVDIPLEEALRMVSTYPAKAIERNDTMGKIQVGSPANLVCLNEALTVEHLVTAD